MTMAPSPIRQSWATWLIDMMRHPLPISVHPPALVARWTVTYSRMAVSAPIRTPEGVSSRNLRSWGRPPSSEPWPTVARSPISTRPSSAQWWPISTPAPSFTSAPTTANARMRTPARSVAFGSTRAVGCTPSIMPAGCPREPRSTSGRLLGSLLVVSADDLVGQVGVRRGIEDRGAPLLHDEVEAPVLADAIDDPRQLLEAPLEQGLLLLLELLLEVVHLPRGVAPLALEQLLLLAPGVGRHQRALLLELVAQLFQLLALALHLALHAGLLALELFARRHAGRGPGQDPRQVEVGDPRVRRRRGGGARAGSLGEGRRHGEADEHRGLHDSAIRLFHSILLERRTD